MSLPRTISRAGIEGRPPWPVKNNDRICCEDEFYGCYAEGEAAIRTVVDTARLSPGTSAFSTILKTVGA
jgi:hypothetical protein